jgi:hypothetical protein
MPQRTDILPVCSPFNRKLYLDARSPAKSIVVSYSATGYHCSAHARHGMAGLERQSDVSHEPPSAHSAGTVYVALYYCSSTCLRIQVSWRTSYQSFHPLELCHGNRPDFDVHVLLKGHRTLCRPLGYSRGVTCICTTLKSCFDSRSDQADIMGSPDVICLPSLSPSNHDVFLTAAVLISAIGFAN